MKTTIIGIVATTLMALGGYAVKSIETRVTATENRISTIEFRELPSAQRIAALEGELKALNVALRDLRDEQRITNSKLDELIFNLRFPR